MSDTDKFGLCKNIAAVKESESGQRAREAVLRVQGLGDGVTFDAILGDVTSYREAIEVLLDPKNADVVANIFPPSASLSKLDNAKLMPRQIEHVEMLVALEQIERLLADPLAYNLPDLIACLAETVGLEGLSMDDVRAIHERAELAISFGASYRNSACFDRLESHRLKNRDRDMSELVKDMLAFYVTTQGSKTNVSQTLYDIQRGAHGEYSATDDVCAFADLCTLYCDVHEWAKSLEYQFTPRKTAVDDRFSSKGMKRPDIMQALYKDLNEQGYRFLDACTNGTLFSVSRNGSPAFLKKSTWVKPVVEGDAAKLARSQRFGI